MKHEEMTVNMPCCIMRITAFYDINKRMYNISAFDMEQKNESA